MREGNKNKTVLLAGGLLLLVFFIFVLLINKYVIKPNSLASKHRVVDTATDTESYSTNDKAPKLEWRDDYAQVEGGVSRLADYTFRPVVEASQLVTSATDGEYKQLFQETIWPLCDEIAGDSRLGKADIRSDNGYNTLTYRVNPGDINEVILKYDCDTRYLVLSYSRQIDTMEYSHDTIVPILNEGAKYVGVQLDADSLYSDIDELLSRKLKNKYGYVSLSYRDYDSNIGVRIEHKMAYLMDDERLDAMVFIFERSIPTVKLN